MAKQALETDLDLGIEQEKRSKKKLLLIVAAGAVVLLAGGLGAGWFIFGGDAGEQVAEDTPPAEETQEKPPAIYQPLDPLFVVNLPPGGDLKMLQIGVQVMVRDPELVEFIEHNDPMIRNTLLNLFGSQEGKALRVRKGKEKLQKDVLKTLNKMVKEQGGSGEIESVFFTAFVMQ